MPANRIPKAIHSRTLSQSVFVNLVAQLVLSFSQPMLAQSLQRPFASAGPTSQAPYEARRKIRHNAGKSSLSLAPSSTRYANSGLESSSN